MRLFLWSGDSSNFSAILTKWNWSNLGFPGIFWKTYWVNGLTFCMLMYSDHLQNCCDYGYSLLIFLILMLFWQILGFHGILVLLCGYFSLWWPFGWNWSYLGFLAIIWRRCGSKCRAGEGRHIFDTLHWVLSSFSWKYLWVWNIS